MSRENVELIRSCYEAVARGDLEAALAVSHPDVEIRGTGRLPDVVQVRGHEAVRSFFEELFSAFQEVQLVPERYIDAGEVVIVAVRQVMRGRGSGVELVNRVVVAWHVRDGKVIRGDSYADEREALEAVGLSE